MKCCPCTLRCVEEYPWVSLLSPVVWTPVVSFYWYRKSRPPPQTVPGSLWRFPSLNASGLTSFDVTLRQTCPGACAYAHEKGKRNCREGRLRQPAPSGSLPTGGRRLSQDSIVVAASEAGGRVCRGARACPLARGRAQPGAWVQGSSCFRSPGARDLPLRDCSPRWKNKEMKRLGVVSTKPGWWRCVNYSYFRERAAPALPTRLPKGQGLPVFTLFITIQN